MFANGSGPRIPSRLFPKNLFPPGLFPAIFPTGGEGGATDPDPDPDPGGGTGATVAQIIEGLKADPMFMGLFTGVDTLLAHFTKALSPGQPGLVLPAPTRPEKAIVRVRTADFGGEPLANQVVTATLDDTQTVCLGDTLRLTREVVGTTKLHTDDEGNQDAYVDLELYHDQELESANLNPIYVLNVGDVVCKIRVPVEGGLASRMIQPDEQSI